MDGYYKKLKAGLGLGRSGAASDARDAEVRAPYFWASFVAAGDSGPLGK
jgi:hypothetical protein